MKVRLETRGEEGEFDAMTLRTTPGSPSLKVTLAAVATKYRDRPNCT